MGAQKINIPQLGIFLGVISAVAAGLLSFVSVSTEAAIKVNLQKKTDAALKQVLPAFDTVETITLRSELDWPIKYYIARKGGTRVGYAGEVITPEGFSGNVTTMVGLELDGTVRTVIITANAETPGLGTAVTDRKVQKTIIDLLKGTQATEGLAPNIYLDWYENKKANKERWPILKEGDQVNGKTGATITSAAIGGAVHAISKTCINHLEELSKGAE